MSENTTHQNGEQPNGKRLVIACGGTGGHLFPGIAVAEAWQNRGGKALLIISEKQIDTLATEGYDHLRFERQKSIAMPPVYSPRMIGFGFSFLKGLFQSRRLLAEFEADAVLGMGGFTSTAPLVAGRWRRLPTFIHESNAIPGRANLLNARFSTRVLVGFDACSSHFGSRPVSTVGTPLRTALVEQPSREQALEKLGLRRDLKTLLVTGGSQGAMRLNEMVGEALKSLPADQVQVIHITGPRDYEKAKAAHDAAPGELTSVVMPFCAEMQWPLAAADLALCRSGASTLTELAAYGLPGVLVPYPFAAHDHQTRNAEVFSKQGAAKLWPQDEMTVENLSARLAALLKDQETLGRMSVEMRSLASGGASEMICDVVQAGIEGSQP